METKSKLEVSRQPSGLLARQSNWLGYPTPILTRHHQLPHLHCPPNGNIQTKQPSLQTTSHHPHHNPKLDFPTYAHHPQPMTMCSRRTHPNRILLSPSNRRIHPTLLRPAADPTILALQYDFLPTTSKYHQARYYHTTTASTLSPSLLITRRMENKVRPSHIMPLPMTTIAAPSKLSLHMLAP